MAAITIQEMTAASAPEPAAVIYPELYQAQLKPVKPVNCAQNTQAAVTVSVKRIPSRCCCCSIVTWVKVLHVVLALSSVAVVIWQKLSLSQKIDDYVLGAAVVVAVIAAAMSFVESEYVYLTLIAATCTVVVILFLFLGYLFYEWLKDKYLEHHYDQFVTLWMFLLLGIIGFIPLILMQMWAAAVIAQNNYLESRARTDTPTLNRV